MTRKKSYRQRVKRARERLFWEQKGLCFYCAQPMLLASGTGTDKTRYNQITLDHVVPRSKGGTSAPTLNAVAACFRCNQERGDKDARAFMLEKQGEKL